MLLWGTRENTADPDHRDRAESAQRQFVEKITPSCVEPATQRPPPGGLLEQQHAALAHEGGLRARDPLTRRSTEDSAMIVLRLTLAVVIVLLTAPGVPAQTAFRWALQEHDKLEYVIEDEYTSKSRIGSLKQKLILNTVWQVKQLGPDGQVEIVLTINRVRFNADGEGAAAIGRIVFDSKEGAERQDQPAKAVSKVFKAVVGPELRLSLSVQGAVTEFELPEMLRATLEDNTTRELAGFFGDVFTAEGLRHRLVNWLVAFPHQPVSVRENWTEKKSSRLGKTLACNHTYVYTGREEREGRTVEKIEITPAYTLAGANPAEEKIKSQDGRGTVYFDSKNGRITEWVLNQKLVLQSFAETTLEGTTTVNLKSAK
jgi:hypothetical protein